MATTKMAERLKALAADRYWGEAEGREALAALEASGLTRAAFSREHGISTQRLRWWSGRLGEETEPNACVTFLPVHLTEAPPERVSAADAVMEIALGEMRVRVGPGFDAAALRRLLAVIAEPAC